MWGRNRVLRGAFCFVCVFLPHAFSKPDRLPQNPTSNDACVHVQTRLKPSSLQVRSALKVQPVRDRHVYEHTQKRCGSILCPDSFEVRWFVQPLRLVSSASIVRTLLKQQQLPSNVAMGFFAFLILAFLIAVIGAHKMGFFDDYIKRAEELKRQRQEQQQPPQREFSKTE
ncbi:hypothetical protein L596_011549 [Steinernema carpocapsae]|uniref:Transmembrane protein n=1 Tax=Steinernema carpocapsae TaxID=34508 RepID=A0A4U5NV49_STECR|nr:hypothetical protein L596_011549 [Steinernema carpocapsae]